MPLIAELGDKSKLIASLSFEIKALQTEMEAANKNSEALEAKLVELSQTKPGLIEQLMVCPHT